jgi:hypothetical protein
LRDATTTHHRSIFFLRVCRCLAKVVPRKCWIKQSRTIALQELPTLHPQLVRHNQALHDPAVSLPEQVPTHSSLILLR